VRGSFITSLSPPLSSPFLLAQPASGGLRKIEDPQPEAAAVGKVRLWLPFSLADHQRPPEAAIFLNTSSCSDIVKQRCLLFLPFSPLSEEMQGAFPPARKHSLFKMIPIRL